MKPSWSRALLEVVATSLLAAPVFASSVSQSAASDREAAELGFSAQRFHQIHTFYAAKVAKGDMSGVVILIARHGELAYLNALGYADIEKQTPMSRDTLFRVYSMTKPLAATALMLLYEDGRFQLDDPISKYIPEFARVRVLMLDHGRFGGQRLLSPQVVDFMTRNHLDDKQKQGMGNGVGFGLGFAVVQDPAAAGFMNSQGSYFWDGVANTHFWVDLKEDLVVVALAQDMSNPADAAFDQEIRSLVYSAMTQ
jgi:CubicO group peptidase (beta-lactamase class C family)